MKEIAFLLYQFKTPILPGYHYGYRLGDITEMKDRIKRQIPFMKYCDFKINKINSIQAKPNGPAYLLGFVLNCSAEQLLKVQDVGEWLLSINSFVLESQLHETLNHCDFEYAMIFRNYLYEFLKSKFLDV